MERRLKERLTGAVALLLLAIIFVPMILDNSAQDDIEITETNIPPEPDVEFKSAVLPVEKLPLVEPPPLPLATTAVDSSTDNTVSSEPLPVTEPISLPVETTQIAVAPVENKDMPAEGTSGDTATRATPAWVVQLGSFDIQANADSLVRELLDQKFPAYIEKVTTDGTVAYKVRIGPELSRPAAEKIVKDLKAKTKRDGIILNVR